jgi:LmbE family N-acetylglucosaminyl deacetylase
MFGPCGKILVVAAHPDDEVLGCGGTMSRLSSESSEVFVLILGEGVTSRDCCRDAASREKDLRELHQAAQRANSLLGVKEVFFETLPDNRFDSLDLLDVVKVVEGYVAELEPEWVFTHSGDDLNKDHRITFQSVLTATRPLPGHFLRGVFSFPILSSTEWNFEKAFNPNFFVDIENSLDVKTRAMSCYPSELREWPHPRSLQTIEHHARLFGSFVGKGAAEPFRIVRLEL